jgi:hypothetical protein
LHQAQTDADGPVCVSLFPLLVRPRRLPLAHEARVLSASFWGRGGQCLEGLRLEEEV